MTAREMFAELGYKFYRKTEHGSMVYRKYNCNTDLGLEIMFHSSIYYEIKSLNRNFDCIISPKLHKAITQQMKELGWIK